MVPLRVKVGLCEMFLTFEGINMGFLWEWKSESFDDVGWVVKIF